MEFKVNYFRKGDRVEALEDGFIECNNKDGIVITEPLYLKGAKGEVWEIRKNYIIVQFDNAKGDGLWSIPKDKVKLINRENKMGLENIPKIIQQHENNLKEKWNKFVKENILVNCETKKEFEDFINFACKNFDLDYLIYKDCFEEVGNELCFNFINNDLFYGDRTYYVSQEEYNDFKILTWSKFIKGCEVNNMEKTFEEVIQDKTVGNVYEQIIKEKVVKSIEITESGFVVNFKQSRSSVGFDETKFILKRKEYDFKDAFKAYKDGKEIESCDTRTRYIYDNADLYFDKNESDWLEINYWLIDEINSKWYIND